MKNSDKAENYGHGGQKFKKTQTAIHMIQKSLTMNQAAIQRHNQKGHREEPYR